MSNKRLCQLQAVSQLLHLQLKKAQLHTMTLAHSRDTASTQLQAARTHGAQVDNGWNLALTAGRILDPTTISTWQAMAAQAQTRQDATEQRFEAARSSHEEAKVELRRCQHLSEHTDALAKTEYRMVIRKKDERMLDAIVEQHLLVSHP